MEVMLMIYQELKSLDAERWTLGSIIDSPDTILIISDIIQPHDFFSKNNQIIYSSCLELWVDGLLNIINLNEKLKEKGKLDDVGGLDYIVSLSIIPTTANIKHHANLIKKFSLLRKIYELGNNIINQNNITDIKEVIVDIESQLINIEQEIRAHTKISSKDIIREIYKDWDNTIPSKT